MSGQVGATQGGGDALPCGCLDSVAVLISALMAGSLGRQLLAPWQGPRGPWPRRLGDRREPLLGSSPSTLCNHAAIAPANGGIAGKY